MAQITCPNCGRQLPEDAKNCPYCGGAIPEESIIPESIEKYSETNKDELCLKDIWVCPDCGEIMREEKECCPNCACPSINFKKEQVEEKPVPETRSKKKSESSLKPSAFIILALVVIVIGGIFGVTRHYQIEREEAARQAAREAEYQQRLEEERQQKKLKEERIRQIGNMISGKSYTCSKGSLVSYAMRDELVYSFDRGGKGTFMLYWVSMAGYDLKSHETISWWINDDEELVVSHNGDRVNFTIGSGFIKASNGDKFYRER